MKVNVSPQPVAPETIFKFSHLPQSLTRDGAVRIELEQGVAVFRASARIARRIATLLDKQKSDFLTAEEERELIAYEALDDYLSLVNRLLRNLAYESAGEIRAA